MSYNLHECIPAFLYIERHLYVLHHFVAVSDFHFRVHATKLPEVFEIESELYYQPVNS